MTETATFSKEFIIETIEKFDEYIKDLMKSKPDRALDKLYMLAEKKIIMEEFAYNPIFEKLAGYTVCNDIFEQMYSDYLDSDARNVFEWLRDYIDTEKYIL